MTDAVAIEEDVFVRDEESEIGLSCDEDRLCRGYRVWPLLLLWGFGLRGVVMTYLECSPLL